MGEILLKQIDMSVNWTVTPETETPLAIYTGWANELGVSPSTSLYSFASDDTSWDFTLAASPYLDSTVVKAFFGSEGGMGFYRQNPGSFSSTQYSLTGVSRFYGAYIRPLLVITWHPTGGDLRSYNTLFQRAGNVTIAYVKHSYYSGSETYRYDAAIRIAPGSITLIGESFATITNVMLFELSELLTSQVIQQVAVMESQPIASRRRYLLTLTKPKAFLLSGAAQFSDGAVAELVRAWQRDTGELAASMVPDPVTGAFSLSGVKNLAHDVTIFRAGYRPLSHGPVIPYEEP